MEDGRVAKIQSDKQIGWQCCIVEDSRVANIQSDKQVGWRWCIVEDCMVAKIQSDKQAGRVAMVHSGRWQGSKISE